MKLIKNSLLFLVPLFLCACSSLNTPQNTVYVKLPPEHRIQFEGKGVGAGIALMSTLGPMGVAIGVAIDEGIAKDIRKSLDHSGFVFQESLKHTISFMLPANTEIIFVDLKKVKSNTSGLVIKKYGFKTIGGEGDKTLAEIEISFRPPDGSNYNIHFPNDFNLEELQTARLDTVKSDGDVAKGLLEQGLVKIINKIFFVEKEKDQGM
ncbi:hypothetical protein SOPP22_01375 [Shewanella sp. OPT22]|nr:hypothetical protein SOPP22_01375 [Shewanella sp. OPT22]